MATTTAATPCVSRKVVERMAAGPLSAGEIRGAARQLVRHLLRGCRDCAIAFGRVAGLPAVTHEVPLFYYDKPVDLGIRGALKDLRAGTLGTGEYTEKTLEREQAAALIEEAQNLRRDDPEEGLELLDWALLLPRADGFCDEGEAQGDLSCEIHAERANLLRLLGRHSEAEQAFDAALVAWQVDGGSAEALFHLGDPYASFLLGRRRFAEADRLLAHLVVTLERRGDLPVAGKLALKRSLAAAYSGDPGKALPLVSEALRLLGGTESPELLELRLTAAQHLIALYVQLGLVQDASDCADAIRAEYYRHMGASDQAKFLFYDAQIYDGLGRRGVAEGLLRRVKAQFQQLGLPFQAAIVGLDLAVRLVERGRVQEARKLLARELIPTFRSIGVAREGLASLVLLERATEAAALDAAVLKSVLRDLERAGLEAERHEDEGEPGGWAPGAA
ncbi:MAG: hypothetical protein ABJC13_09205 [Acidobacteriota bacterium]